MGARLGTWGSYFIFHNADDELPTESSSDSSSSSEENSSESDEEDAAVSVKSKEDLKTNNSLHHGTGHKHCT